jgi:hypothetical protein
MTAVTKIADFEGKKVVATDVAEQEFERFLDAMDIDRDPASMDEDDKKGFEDAKRKFVKQVEVGRLVVDEKGQPVYTTHAGKTLIFHEPTGASFMAMDSKKKGADVAKMCAVMADIAHCDPSEFAKMPNRDFQVCKTIITLFLG